MRTCVLVRVAPLLAFAMAGRPAKDKLPKHHLTRGLFYHPPVGVAEVDAVAADPAPDDQPTAGVGNATGEPQPASQEEAAPAKKRQKVILKDIKCL